MFAYLSSVFSKKQKNQRMVPLVEIVTIVFWDGGLILMTLGRFSVPFRDRARVTGDGSLSRFVTGDSSLPRGKPSEIRLFFRCSIYDRISSSAILARSGERAFFRKGLSL